MEWAKNMFQCFSSWMLTLIENMVYLLVCIVIEANPSWMTLGYKLGSSYSIWHAVLLYVYTLLTGSPPMPANIINLKCLFLYTCYTFSSTCKCTNKIIWYIRSRLGWEDQQTSMECSIVNAKLMSCRVASKILQRFS